MVTKSKEGRPDDAQPRQPRTALELARITDALSAPPSCLPGKKCWIIASTQAPMHRVLGAAPTLEEARARIRAARKDGVEGWTKRELASLAPYGEFDLDPKRGSTPLPPGAPTKSLLSPWQVCWHDCFSEFICPRPPIEQESILGVELRIEVRGAAPVVITIPKTADLVVFQRSAWEKFILPHYERQYGKEYVHQLRGRTEGEAKG